MTTSPSSFDRNELKGSFNPLSSVDNNPQLDAVLSKLIPDQRRGASPRQRANVSTRGLTSGTLQRVSQRTAGDIQDVKSLLQMLPDMELAMQILISSILSPKDLAMPKLNYQVESGRFNSEVTGKMVETVRDFFDNTYKINELLPKILEDALFMTGSYPLMVLPENAIDEVINRPERVSFESLVNTDEFKQWTCDSIGLLGNGVPDEHGAALESFSDFSGGRAAYDAKVVTYKFGTNQPVTELDLKLKVIDNPDVLKRSRLNERMRRDRVSQIMEGRGLHNKFRRGATVAVEALSAHAPTTGYTNNGPSFSDHALYRGRRTTRGAQVAVLPTPDSASRPTVGHPLVMKLPSESVIPVHVPGAPDDHVGYFVMLDEHGNPVNMDSSRDFYSDMGSMLKQNTAMTSQIISNVARAQGGADAQSRGATQIEVQELEQAYTDLVEMDLNRRLRGGVYGSNVQVARPSEVYRMMLARAYSQRQTQLLYVPAELLTYIAFDYNEYGIGQSLMQKTKIIASIRATLLFANVMSGVKNSIARTRLKIQLSEEDPEPDMTVEEYIHNHVRNSRGLLPIGVGEPSDIIAHLNNASYEVEVSGNNPRYPETSMMVESFNSDKSKPDTVLEDALRDRHLMAIGVPPELVVSSQQADFATQAVQTNLLLSKRVMVYQSILLPFLDEFIQRFVINSQILMDQLREIVRANADKLSRSQRVEQSEAQADGHVDVDEDLRNLVQVVADKQRNDSVQVDAVVYEFIQGLNVKLPTPELSQSKNNQESYEQHEQLVDKLLPAYVDELFMNEAVMGDLADAVPMVKNTLKAIMMRSWARNNNIMPEMDELTSFNPDGSPAVDMLKIALGHQDAMRASMLGFMKHANEQVGKVNKQLTDSKQAAGLDPEAGATDYGSVDTPADAGGGADDAGFGDFEVPETSETAVSDPAADPETDPSAPEDITPDATPGDIDPASPITP